MTQKPVRTPPATDAAKAFEELRREISLQRTAIEGLTSAKEKLPDYSLTLRDIASRLAGVEKHVEGINERPAMRLTPLTIATEMHEGLITVKRRSKGTPDRRRRGTPFSDNMMLVC